MGIVHFSEKAGADQPLLQRFSDLSRMALVLHEYPDAAAESAVLPDDEFENFFGELSACLDRKKALQDELAAAHAAAERLAEWGCFSPPTCSRCGSKAGTSTFTAQTRRL